MTTASALVFGDAERRPTEKAILAALGPAASAWTALFEQLHATHPELTEEWNYYADGKSWLLKMKRGSRTVFWGLVERGAFRITFYFADRLTPALLEAEQLSKTLRADLAREPLTGALRAVSLRFDSAAAMHDVLALVALKQSLK